jgi:diacylglycerol kinase family enzyme
MNSHLSFDFGHKTAFLLNKNARAVTDKRVAELAALVPVGDFFLSRTFSDAEAFVRTIVRRGYKSVFLGGGDGTLMATMNLLQRAAASQQTVMPSVGILRLGTGNAMGHAFGAADPLVDVHHVLAQGPSHTKKVHLVETDDGTVCPFAGVGYDGLVLNDFLAVKNAARHTALGPMMSGLTGYLAAALTRSVPGQVGKKSPTLRIRSTKPSTWMRHGPHGDEPVACPAGAILHEGPAAMVSVGAIPFFGFGFRMFPFAMQVSGRIQLRVGNPPIASLLANLWPSIWRGTWRHPQLLDFLVEDVEIESDMPLPYQVGGDGGGFRERISFRTSSSAVDMCILGERLTPPGHAWLPVGPTKTLVRLPR